jgi:transcriptional regulator with XRE-family HTH domain
MTGAPKTQAEIDYTRSFIARVNEIRRERNLTARDLAALTGTNLNSMAGALGGKKQTVTVWEAIQFAEALGVPLGRLVPEATSAGEREQVRREVAADLIAKIAEELK